MSAFKGEPELVWDENKHKHVLVDEDGQIYWRDWNCQDDWP